MSSRTIESDVFRRVLGQYPTGVCIVTATTSDGAPAGLAVGSFTSVSLDPPLVAFLPAKSSTSWPKMRSVGSFCVNVLAADQDQVCRAFAVAGGDKFAGLTWRPAESGAPILDGVLAWIDCDLDAIHEAGDHEIVLGRVRALEIERPALPLVFFQGGYGRFLPQSLATVENDLVAYLRQLELARPEIEALAQPLELECTVSAIVGDDHVAIARAGRPRGTTLLGTRFPVMPPVGMLFLAWAGEDAVERWLRRADPPLSESHREAFRDALGRIRRRGYMLLFGRELPSALEPGDTEQGVVRAAMLLRAVEQIGIETFTRDMAGGKPAPVSLISAPVFDANGNVILSLNLLGFDSPLTPAAIGDLAARVTDAARRVTAASGGMRRA
jgi:flavin reductase (DIM6/NTAB) family NADH-FMN oxidoreductase RutF/DNA-binding IclR family transcriptional regulator